MAIIGGNTNFTKTENPVQHRNHWRWGPAGLVVYAYTPEQCISYEWETDAAGYAGGLINPDTLSAGAGWAPEWYGEQRTHGKLHGRYIEKYVWRGTFTLL
jgi:hypothetical protein